MSELVKKLSNGQWTMEKRCWEGYEPTPGKKAYEKDSCQPVKKDELQVAPKNSNNKKTFKQAFKKSSSLKKTLKDNEMQVVQWEDGTLDIESGRSVNEQYFESFCKSLCEKADLIELSKKEWSPKSEHKSDKGGLTEAGRKSYNKATGGNLKAPQPQGGPRKRSFCARNKGQIDMHDIDCRETPDKRACKARRRWKC
jgi:hypothetical protein